ncbi:unnamed protein product, partial [Prorocentrum cordatum]
MAMVLMLELAELHSLRTLASKMGDACLERRCQQAIAKLESPPAAKPLAAQLSSVTFARERHVRKLGAAISQPDKLEKAAEEQRDHIEQLSMQLEEFYRQHDLVLAQLHKPKDKAAEPSEPVLALGSLLDGSCDTIEVDMGSIFDFGDLDVPREDKEVVQRRQLELEEQIATMAREVFQRAADVAKAVKKQHQEHAERMVKKRRGGAAAGAGGATAAADIGEPAAQTVYKGGGDGSPSTGVADSGAAPGADGQRASVQTRAAQIPAKRSAAARKGAGRPAAPAPGARVGRGGELHGTGPARSGSATDSFSSITEWGPKSLGILGAQGRQYNAVRFVEMHKKAADAQSIRTEGEAIFVLKHLAATSWESALNASACKGFQATALHMQRGNVVVITLYLFPGGKLGGINTEHRRSVGRFVKTLADPWVIIGDWNTSMDKLQASKSMKLLDGVLIKPDVEVTCTTGPGSSLIDFAFAKRGFEGSLKLRACQQAPWKTHVGLELVIASGHDQWRHQ